MPASRRTARVAAVLVAALALPGCVLLPFFADEGGGNEKQIYAYVREQTALVADLAERMCLFDRVDCLERARESLSE